MVEQGEECDCGYSDQCKDECCYDANQPEGKKCKLKPGKQCRYPACPGGTQRCHRAAEGSYDPLKIDIKRSMGFGNSIFICCCLTSFSGVALMSAVSVVARLSYL